MCAASIVSLVLSAVVAQATSAAPNRPEAASAQPTHPAAAGATAPAAAEGNKAAPASSGALSVDVEFMESTGATLAERHVRLVMGTPETISVQQGNRTVLLEATVRPGAKAGCHKLEVTLRDRRIDASGRFNKTVWQSGSEPCTATPFVLDPKDETRIKIALKPAS